MIDYIESIKTEPVILYWTFENDHIYNKSFDTVNDALEFTNRCGLVSHPYIISVFYRCNNMSVYIKGA